MPLYEYYCESCNGVFDAFRQIREASEPVPCPQCDEQSDRIMSSFTAFTMREGYPRKIPDKGTYWHMGKEVKRKAKRMKGWEHPELAKPKPKPRPTRGERGYKAEKAMEQAREMKYRDRWGRDSMGFKTTKEKKRKPARRTL